MFAGLLLHEVFITIGVELDQKGTLVFVLHVILADEPDLSGFGVTMLCPLGCSERVVLESFPRYLASSSALMCLISSE